MHLYTVKHQTATGPGQQSRRRLVLPWPAVKRPIIDRWDGSSTHTMCSARSSHREETPETKVDVDKPPQRCARASRYCTLLRPRCREPEWSKRVRASASSHRTGPDRHSGQPTLPAPGTSPQRWLSSHGSPADLLAPSRSCRSSRVRTRTGTGAEDCRGGRGSCRSETASQVH